MKIKVKPDPFYSNWTTIYIKYGWWPFWRKAGWTYNQELDAKIESLLKQERWL